MPHVPSAILCTAAVGLAATTVHDAGAVTLTRSFVHNATGTCQAALPSFEGLVRKRPLALQNEGSDSAFVSCSLVGTHLGPGYNGRVMDRVFMGLINDAATPVAVSCTLVDGVAGAISASLIPKLAAIPANGRAELEWAAADNGDQRFVFAANVQCVLPPGTGISYTSSWYEEDVGD